MKTTERMCNLKISVQNLLWRKLSWTALAVPGWCGGERKGGECQPWTLLLLASDWRPWSSFVITFTMNTGQRIKLSNLTCGSPARWDHCTERTGNWKHRKLAFFHKLKRFWSSWSLISCVLFSYLKNQYLAISLLRLKLPTVEETYLWVASVVIGNGLSGYYIISVEICEMTSIHYQS